MAEVRYYLKNPKAKKKSRIYLDFPYDGKRLQTPTDLSIAPSKWNTSKGKFKHQYAHEEWYEPYNELVGKITKTVLTYYADQKALGVIPQPKSIKDHLTKTTALQPEEDIQNEFFALYDKFLSVRAKEVSPRTIQKNETLRSLLINFSESTKRHLSFDTIDLSFFDDFKNFLYAVPNKKVPSGYGLLDASVHKYVSVLKTFLTWTYDREYHKNQSHVKFSVPIKRKEEIITLRECDVKSIEEIDLTNHSRLEKVRDIFLFGFHTLQRWSDIERFNQEDLHESNDGYKYWKFESYKTREEIIVPFVGFSEKAFNILKKYQFELPKISAQKFNDYLKELGKLAGLDKVLRMRRRQANRDITIEKKLYEFMSSHIMRRSGITFLLEKGVPPTTILKITGHEDLATLMKYENTSNDAVVEALERITY